MIRGKIVGTFYVSVATVVLVTYKTLHFSVFNIQREKKTSNIKSLLFFSFFFLYAYLYENAF
jgi:hypothetical protein